MLTVRAEGAASGKASVCSWAWGKRDGRAQRSSSSPYLTSPRGHLGGRCIPEQRWSGQALKDSREQGVLGPWKGLTQAWSWDHGWEGSGGWGPSHVMGSMGVYLQAMGPGEGTFQAKAGTPLRAAPQSTPRPRTTGADISWVPNVCQALP